MTHFAGKAAKVLLLSTATTLLLAVSALAAEGDIAVNVGATTGSNLRLRAEASTDSSIVTTLNKGVAVSVLDSSVEGWYKISFNGNTGYVSADYMIIDQDNVFETTGRINTDSVNVRTDATTDSPYPGVYYILGEMYVTQVLVISELSPEESLYLYCLAGKLTDSTLINSLTQDYTLNKENELYIKYMHQFLGSHMKGEQIMVCENLFKLYGTSSKEIADNATKKAQELYIPQIDKLTSENSLLHSEIDKFKKLLAENNISY